MRISVEQLDYYPVPIVARSLSEKPTQKKDGKPINHGAPWTDEKKECLKEMYIQKFEPYNEDIFYIEASKKFGRTREAIRCQLHRMELINYPYTGKYAIRKLKELRKKHS